MKHARGESTQRFTGDPAGCWEMPREPANQNSGKCRAGQYAKTKCVSEHQRELEHINYNSSYTKHLVRGVMPRFYHQHEGSTLTSWTSSVQTLCIDHYRTLLREIKTWNNRVMYVLRTCVWFSETSVPKHPRAKQNTNQWADSKEELSEVNGMARCGDARL